MFLLLTEVKNKEYGFFIFIKKAYNKIQYKYLI